MNDQNEEIKTKKCYDCKILKSLDEFHKDGRTKDGRRFKCKECVAIYMIEYNKKDSKYKTKYNREYRIKKGAELCTRESEWYHKNKKHVLEVKKIYRRKKRANDPLFRARNAVSRRIKGVLGGAKSKKSMEILGCDMLFFRSHLESLWLPGMTWDNYGIHGWHIDHKIPLASANTTEEIEKLCHYTNLQPLWALDNLKKSDKIS